MISKSRRRIKWIDFARAAAIILVILCHATEGICRLNPENVMSLPMESRVFCFSCFTLGRLGVPFFLMITGSLLLTRKYDTDSIIRFWKQKWLHLLICTLIWFTIYVLYLRFYFHKTDTFLQYLMDMLFLHKIGMSHVWYLPIILGLYILLPFAAVILHRFDDRLFLFPTLIFTLYAFGYPLLQVIFRGFQLEPPLSRQFSLGFSGGEYGLYILYGYFVRKGAFKKIRSIVVFFAAAVFFAALIYLQIWSYQCNAAYNAWYDNLLLLLVSILVFELISRLKNIYGYKAVKLISYYSFPLYLIHNIVRYTTVTSIRSSAFTLPVQVLLLWVFCFFISLGAAIVIECIPKLGKYILYLR